MPARSGWDGDVIVYRYRCPARAGRDIPDEALTQLRLAHDLRNTFVELERGHEQAKQQVWRSDRTVAAALDRLAAADAAVDALVEKAAGERRQDRSTRPREATAAALAGAKKARKTAKDALREAQDAALPGLRDEFARLRSQLRRDLQAAGREAKAAGLPWHTHDMVMADHVTAAARIEQQRAAGRPAQLRFHRWQGEGTLRATLMRSAWRHGCGGKKPPWPCQHGIEKPSKNPADCPERVPHHPPRTPELLTEAGGGGPWRNVVTLPPHMDPAVCAVSPPRRHGERETLRFRLASGVWWDVPVFVHRPLPVGAEVVSVQVTRRRVAAQHRLSVTVTVRVPRAAPAAGDGRVALHVGWRSLGPGEGVRVGVVSSTVPLPAPPDQPEIAGVIRIVDAHTAEIVAPGFWRDLDQKTADLRSIRDQALDAARDKIVAALAEGVDGVDVSAGEVSRWRSPGRFARLVREWPADHPLAETLEEWRRQDKHLWLWEAHGGDQLAARRLDTWRKVAAWLTGAPGVGKVVVDKTDIRELSKVPAVGEEDDEQARAGRVQRQVASPGELRARVVAAAARRGVTVEKMDAAVRVHGVCGQVIVDGGQFAAGVSVWCPTCGHGFDQDVNAAGNLLSRPSGDSAGKR